MGALLGKKSKGELCDDSIHGGRGGGDAGSWYYLAIKADQKEHANDRVGRAADQGLWRSTAAIPCIEIPTAATERR